MYINNYYFREQKITGLFTSCDLSLTPDSSIVLLCQWTQYVQTFQEMVVVGTTPTAKFSAPETFVV